MQDLTRKINTGTPGTEFFPRPRPRPRLFGKYRGIPARPRRGPRPRATLQ